ncbi:MAG: hypothetical protein DRJ10_16265 [Bacteroidetes bacterium]|nr:MAG: hypothetical protein DRJ10_16265 [Bacteroidota bacterium]
MENSNLSNISGDHNISFTGVDVGGDIIIKIADDLPPEVKKQKQELSVRIEELVGQLSALKKDSTSIDSNAEQTEIPENPLYSKIKWRRLIQAIKHQGCVLFIGPEISIDEKGESLHQYFYKQLAEDFDDVDFLEEEGFFTPGADEEILYDMLDYYKEEFQTQNSTGRSVLEKLAQFPFSLTISLCPDDTIHRICDDFDIKHQYVYYDGTKKEMEMPENDNPIIYNILGSARENGRYIFTHENLYNYLNEISIPPIIKKKIQDATHFLFIGFDFSKWYNRLLLFVLDFENKQAGVNRLNIEKKNIPAEFEKFIEKQFNIASVHDGGDEFIDWLIQNAKKEEGLLKDLSQSFILTNFSSLQRLSTKVSDEKMLEALLKINEEADIISKKINSFKLLIT